MMAQRSVDLCEVHLLGRGGCVSGACKVWMMREERTGRVLKEVHNGGDGSQFCSS